MMKRFKRVAVCLAAGLFTIGAMAGGAFAQTVTVTQAAPAGPGWPRDRSDLPHDNDYVLGELANGMRYVILPNQTPPRQVALRLLSGRAKRAWPTSLNTWLSVARPNTRTGKCSGRWKASACRWRRT
jgi:hypothetical protein